MSNEQASRMDRRTRRRIRRAERRKRALAWILIVILLPVAAALNLKPVYHWLKSKRAEQFANAGDEFAKAGKWNDAAAKYRAALQLDPLGYRTLEGAARLASRLNRPEAVDLWEQVNKKPEATIADRQEYAGLLINLGRLQAAEKIVTELLKNDPDARTLMFGSRYSSKMGEDAKAIEFARIAVKRAPHDDAVRTQLAELLAKSTEAAERAEARQILWELAGKDGIYRQSAIEALARAPGLSGSEHERVLQLLDAISPPNITDTLLAADLRLQLHPEDVDRIYNEAVARWQESGTADVIALLRWLNLQQQPERVLAVVPLNRALQDNQLLLAHLDALGSLQRWKEIDELLASSTTFTLDPSVLESFRARAAQERHATVDAETHWNQAIALAAPDPFKLRFVANFAEQSHATAAALKAYEQLAKFPAHAAFAYLGTQRLSVRSGDVSAQRAAAEKIAAHAPNDPNAADELVYLNLLAGIDANGNAEVARKLAEKHPERLSFRVTAALGCLRQKDPASALAQFKGPPIDWPKTSAAWRAVYAATLIANGQDDSAREMIATIPMDRLSAEERALLPPETK